MKKYAVVVAAGSGSRMGNTMPKQFLPLCGKPVLYHTLKAFLGAWADLQVILVLPAAHLQAGRQVVELTKAAGRVLLAEGGATRFQSVKNGLAHVPANAIVFVHDGVRCMVSRMLIERCYQQAIQLGSAIPAVPATDTIRLMNDVHHQQIDRNLVRIVQTPQTFQSNILLQAFAQPEQAFFTDEASVVEASGHAVHLVEGEYDNIKITRPVDLVIAQSILEQRSTL